MFYLSITNIYVNLSFVINQHHVAWNIEHGTNLF
jgi:hypothetical protein